MGARHQFHSLATLAQKKSPHYPLDMRMDGPQSQSGCCEKEIISFSCQIRNPDWNFGFWQTKSLIVISYIFITYHHTNAYGQDLRYDVLLRLWFPEKWHQIIWQTGTNVSEKSVGPSEREVPILQTVVHRITSHITVVSHITLNSFVYFQYHVKILGVV